MLVMNDALRNMRFMMECLKNIPENESLTLGNGGFCVSTRTESENWVCFPERVRDAETVKRIAEFFGARGEYFLWPVFDGGCKILAEGGLVQDESLRAMSLDPDSPVLLRGNDSVTIQAVTSGEGTLKWAEAAWRGFGYDGETPAEDFCGFARNLLGCENFGMYVAELGGKSAGTCLTVSDDAGLVGVNYLSVVPEMRRKGIAAAMMNEIRSLSHGKKIVLQSSLMGVPFYTAYGFKDCGEIKVFRNREV